MNGKHQNRFKEDPATCQLAAPAGGVRMETFIPWTLVKHRANKQVITPLDAPQEFMQEVAGATGP